MQYNTKRDPLAMPEYGRGVQAMAELAVAIPDRAERQRCAAAIVAVMARVLPQQGERCDCERRLWNHLARISRYRLDIDYPVDIVPEEEAAAHPSPLKYPMTRIRRRHYGHLVEESLRHAQTLPQGEERDALVGMVANQMKQDLYMWNRDAMDDRLVAQDIERYSDGQLAVDPDAFRFAPVGAPAPQQTAARKARRKR